MQDDWRLSLVKQQPIIIALSIAIGIFFLCFLILPLGMLFRTALSGSESTISLEYFGSVLQEPTFWKALINSIHSASLAALTSTIIAILLVIGDRTTNLPITIKQGIRIVISLPMLLPTLTYGFVILYAFGKQGIITKFLGHELFNFYGFNGLWLGYVIYTLPAAFLLIDNAAEYLDGRMETVSILMGDSWLASLWRSWLRPLSGAIGGSFVLSFILSITDYGIPAAIGGTYPVFSTRLYDLMLGSLPSIEKGAVMGILLLAPAMIGFGLLSYLDRFNFHTENPSAPQLRPNFLKTFILGGFSISIAVCILLIFSTLFWVPFVKNFPYDNSLTMTHIINALEANNLLAIFKNSVLTALTTALIGTVVAFIAALVNSRSKMPKWTKRTADFTAMLCNTIPGLVIGIAYLLIFRKTDLKGTLMILTISNVVHFFTTPYLMAKNALSKMDPTWETTAELLGDSWLKTVYRIILPNARYTITDMLTYFFVNSMVTISAVIFLVSSRSMVLTAKIKELQYFAQFTDVFVLSLLILLVNVTAILISKLSKDVDLHGLITRRLRHLNKSDSNSKRHHPYNVEKENFNV